MTSLEVTPPCVVILHEVWGPDSNIDAVRKRLGKLGFATTTPALYRGHESLLTPNNIRKAMDAVWDLSLEERRDKKKLAAKAAEKGADVEAMAVLSVLYDKHFRDGMLNIVMSAIARARRKHTKVATLGFSLGGGLALASTTRPDHPDAAVAYCGEPPKREAIRGVSVPMLVICASHDELMNPLMPGFVESALGQGLDLTVKTFPGTRHDFFNQSIKERYNHDAAQEAWEITTWFLARKLGWTPYPSKRQGGS